MALHSTPSSPTLLSPPLFADIRCPDCPPTEALLDENRLRDKKMISFAMLQPCGHTYCIPCFTSRLLALDISSHLGATQRLKCTGSFLENGRWVKCSREVIVPKMAPTADEVVLEMRECRWNSIKTCELRLSLIEHRERITPGQVEIRGSQVQAQPDPNARNISSPVWVFVVLAERFDVLWQLTRELRANGQLFRRVSIDQSPSIDQQVAMQQQQVHFPFPNQSSLDSLPSFPPARDQLDFVNEAVMYNKPSGNRPDPPPQPPPQSTPDTLIRLPNPPQLDLHQPLFTYAVDLERLTNAFEHR